MKYWAFSLIALIALLWAPLAECEPNEAEDLSFREALTKGKAQLSLRYRFETVDDDFFDDVAEASTLRTSLSYRTAKYRGWSFFIEAEDVSPIFDDDDYNNAGAGSLNNGVRGVPVVADPNLTEINQAYVAYQNERIELKIGRQEINIGDQRFVGAVAWRQNHQSFDGVRFRVRPQGAFSLDYSFVSKVHRIFGDTRDLEGHFLWLPFKFNANHQLSVYGFWTDFDDVPLLSTATYGFEYKGKVAFGEGASLKWEAELAQQDDAGDNPSNIDTSYANLSLGGDFGRFGADVTWELLGDRGDGDRSFQAPLSTLHKWNGWADKFLVTPGTGLETLYLRFRGKISDQWRFMLVYHDFQSDGGDLDYGTELDGELVFTAPWKQKFALKFASFEADQISTDTQKLMLWSSYAF